MILFFHKLYKVTQAIILISGTLLAVWIIHQASGLFTNKGVYEHARNCAVNNITEDIPLVNGLVKNLFSHKWTSLVHGAILVKGDIKLMKAEADRITKACHKYLEIDVDENSGEISLFVIQGDTLKPVYDWSQLFNSLGVVLGGTFMLSIFLFVLKKWIKIVFR